jgi:hypothetical protein
VSGPPRVVCLEGPSAVGKTTLAAALAHALDVPVVPELAGGPPPDDPAVRATWFLARHVALWQEARAAALHAPFAVLDGDPFKGLWYDWAVGGAGWAGLDVVGPLHRAAVASGALAFPSLYVLLQAPEATLRARRAADATRTRRHFETNLRLVAPQRGYFDALAAAAPGRVVVLDVAADGPPVDAVRDAVRRLPPGAVDAAALLEHALAWVGTRAPRV